MAGRRQKNQLELALFAESRGETPSAAMQGTEPVAADRGRERQVSVGLMEAVVAVANVKSALQRVRSNKGAPGVDGMGVGQLPKYLKQHWSELREQLLNGTYQPQPVRRVEIPKPGGGVRELGVPTVLDRFVQQALLQVLQAQWDSSFSVHSYGFRPGRSAHQAVRAAQEYQSAGCRWVVDLDLERFFDRVNHDVLMGRVAKRVDDQRVLRLVRSFLNCGVLADGLVSPTDEGTPQGGPLSPLLSNLLLDDLDRELEGRGLSFVRYADDCNIYVRSRRAGERVMASVSQYLTRKLKLRVNLEKSAVDRPWRRKFLGFSFTRHLQPRRRIAPQSVQRFKQRVRELTSRSRGRALDQVIAELARYLTGWLGYFGWCETPSVLEGLEEWLRRRLRCLLWKRWKRSRRRYQELTSRGVSSDEAKQTVGSARSLWRLSRTKALHLALPTDYFTSLGLPKLVIRTP
jgi:RNA-directed DNA polymerase